jgi:hypothetical protein
LAETDNIIFISHANPEDNEFTQWLALQLTQLGYSVWTDITGLLGGEDFWKEAEDYLRNKTIKFLFVLSRISNAKLGPRQELQVAVSIFRQKGYADFIIPLLIDDLPYSEINIQLSRLNVISFKANWSTGFSKLIEKLEKDNIPKTAQNAISYVAEWWRTNRGSTRSIVSSPEAYISNIFPINKMPSHLFYHHFDTNNEDLDAFISGLEIPAFRYKGSVISFAGREEMQREIGSKGTILESEIILLPDFSELQKKNSNFRDRQKYHNVMRLLNLSWRLFLKNNSLPQYEFSQRTICFYFTNDILPTGKSYFYQLNGARSWRKLISFRTISRLGQESWKRWWHFGISLSPCLYPILGYVIRPHVLFSDDGNDVWQSKELLHKARRNQCKLWWNHHWRDRILASIAFLAKETDSFNIPIAENISMTISSKPIIMESPIKYLGISSIDDATISSFDDEVTGGSDGDTDDLGAEDDWT